MSAYIRCPKCREDTLDADTLLCDCGTEMIAVGPDECVVNRSDLMEMGDVNSAYGCAECGVLDAHNADCWIGIALGEKEKIDE